MSGGRASAARSALSRSVLARSGNALAVLALVLLVAVALLGPSAASPHLGGSGPSRSFGLAPPDWVVSVMMWIGLASGTAGVLAWWVALREGWTPSVRRVLLCGALAATCLAVVPPLGSTDVAAYGAYGRMAVLGLNPYTHDIDDLAARGDPFGLAYEGAWPEASSVYGPVALGVFGMASRLAGTSLVWFVFVLQLFALVVFLTTAWLLLAGAGRDPTARARVAVLWAANPVLMYLVVNSAHVDGIAVGLGVAGLLFVARSPAASGVLAALAVGTKVSYALYALALGWALRADRARLLRLVAAGLFTGALVLSPYMPEIFPPLQTASGFLARESLWWFVSEVLKPLVPDAGLSRILAPAAWLLTAVVAWRLRLAVPHRRFGATAVNDALRAAVVLSTAWLLASTYALPWYDVIAWAPLVLLPSSAFDLLALTRTGLASIGYAPGVAITPTGWVAPLGVTLRGFLAPMTSLLLVIAALRAPTWLRVRPGGGASGTAST